ncbi:MAG TPA: L-threonylcarbamoyladenylate synthase, partial [Longimicrobiales bacterium]|nr:L-threonylcarbamoyladenylate synthase [Longimicrobiales bacterium]
LRAGGLVAFPTETVYGLGGHALDPAAVRRIFAAKGRPAHNPLIVHVPDAHAARALVAAWPERAARLADAFWPGPLTLVLPRGPLIPDEVTAGLGTVAVRVPRHPVALALLRAAAIPVAAPSANPYTRVSPTTAEHVAKGLGERVDLILDGGPTEVGIESAVVDLSSARPALLRPGAIERAALEAVVGPLARPEGPAAGAPRPSPGMDTRHYAPGGEVRRFAPDQRAQAAHEARAAAATGTRVGALVLEPMGMGEIEERRLPREPGAYARGLYGALHELEDAGCALILVEDVPDDDAWAGVRDRLARAAG